MPTRPTTHDPAAAHVAADPRPALSRRRALGGLAAVGAVALLAACASADPGSTDDLTTEPPTPTPAETLELAAGSSVVGLPDDLAAPPADAVAGAARTSDDTLVYVITWGSSTCPQVAAPEAEAAGDGAVRVTFPEQDGGPCTQDYVPATSVVALPDTVAPDADLTVQVGDWGEVTLPAGSLEPGWVAAEG